eukprot:363384-Chlamydomonas_euryale.AAC.26
MHAAVPDGILTIEQLLPAIGLLAGDAIAANDLSASSSRDLFRILLLALPRHPGWACGVMSDVVAVLGVGFVDLAALSAAVRSRVVALIEDHEAAAGERFKTGELDQDEGVNSTRAGRRVTRASGGCQEDAESMPRADCDDAGECAAAGRKLLVSLPPPPKANHHDVHVPQQSPDAL